MALAIDFIDRHGASNEIPSQLQPTRLGKPVNITVKGVLLVVYH